jgi:hypothetical protein
MGTQSYSLRREHNRWIVCAAGRELMACADKRTALRIIKAAAALKGDEAESVPPPPSLIKPAGATGASLCPAQDPDVGSDHPWRP